MQGKANPRVESGGVLIVGAGPTGLMLACELARRGIPLRIIDEADQASVHSKAIGVQARTLEIFDRIGVAEALISLGIPCTGADISSDGKSLVRVSFDELDTRYPFILVAPQSDTELVLTERLRLTGHKIERRMSFLDLEQDPEQDPEGEEGGVWVTIGRPDDKEERVRFDYVVGCDGARSAVRKTLGVSFGGTTYPETFALADVDLGGDVSLPRDRFSTYFAGAGPVAFFPLPGERFRVITTWDEELEGEAPSLEALEAVVVERTGLPFSFVREHWRSAFRLHCRQVERYRVGRVFLAGDAAHIHSPFGGQGMNTGIQDAHNLAWKLALVMQGRARPSLLDSYQAERHGIAAEILRSTDYATRVSTLQSPIAQGARNQVARFLSQLEVIQQRVTRQVAELTISYAKSPIVAEHHEGMLRARLFGFADSDERPNLGSWRAFASAPAAGERAPDAYFQMEDGHFGRLYRLCGARHVLLLFDGVASTLEGYERLARLAEAVRARYPEDVDCYLVTPQSERPAELRWDGPVLLDTQRHLEHRYGAQSECIYLIRPDLYVGFRAQPVDEEAFYAHLDEVILPASARPAPPPRAESEEEE